MGREREYGGKFHLRLNTNTRPIENKYREGKVKRTLKRGLKVPEIVKGEAKMLAEMLRTINQLTYSNDVFQRQNPEFVSYTI